MLFHRLVPLLLLSAVSAQQGPKPGLLQGQVVDVLGAGVPAARVRLVDGERPLREVVSDGDGMFVVPGLAPGDLRVHVATPGKASTVMPVPAGDVTHFLRVVLHDAAALRGRVGTKDKAIAGAHVTARATLPDPNGSEWQASTVSDAQGNFVFADAPLGPLSVAAWAPGHLLEEVRRARGVPAVDLAPVATAAPSRRVQAALPSGEPLAGARLLLLDSHGDPMSGLPPPLRAITTDALGAALLPPMPSRHHLGVDCKGHSTVPVRVPCEPGARDVIRFELSPLPPRLAEPQTAVAWRVLTKDGAPVPGVVLLCSNYHNEPLGTAATDDAGTARITVPLRPHSLCMVGLAPCLWLLDNHHAVDDRRGVRWVNGTADPAEVRTLRATPASGVRLRAINARNEVMPFASVSVLGEGRNNRPRAGAPQALMSQLAVATTDRDGRCEVLGLPPGTFRVVVLDPVRGIAVSEVAVAGGKVADVPPWRFQPVGAVEGVLTDANGQPQPGVRVYARFAPEGPDALAAFPGDTARLTFSDRNGRYRMNCMPAGAWTVGAESSHPTNVQVDADATTTLPLQTPW